MTSYSARRVLPSLASASGLSVPDSLALGAWQDPTAGAEARRMAMPSRYNDEALSHAVRTKQALVDDVRTAVHAQGVRFSAGDNPSWEKLTEAWPARGAAPGKPAIQRQEDSSSDTDSSSSSSCDRIDDCAFMWLLAQGPKGRLHIARPDATGCETMCKRVLANPSVGYGRSAALGTGAEWSPRCKALLPARLAAAWDRP